MSLVYDSAPDTPYEPERRLGHSALRMRAGQLETFDPHPNELRQKPAGFGNVIARRMLASGPPPKHPWLTVALAEQELAIGEYQADRVQCALDTIR